MPIALALQEAFAPLARLTEPLDTWLQVLRLETVVIDRARGAFLVDWFGPRLPRIGQQLVVAISNVQELAVQYREARARSIGGQTGPNLLEPVAGLAGTVVGIAISPTAAFLYLYAALRTEFGFFPSILLSITHAIPMAEIVTGLGGAAALILFPIAILVAFGAGIAAAAGADTLPLVYETLGVLANTIQAFTRFINLLTGPRSAIRNPLLRGILELLDKVAALFAQGIGAVALIVTRIGPLILPNAKQFHALIGMAEATGAMLRLIFQGTVDALLGLLESKPGERASPWEIVQSLVRHLMRSVERLLEGAERAISALASAISSGVQSIIDLTRSNIDAIFSTARGLIMDFPLIRTFRAAKEMASQIKALVARARPSAPSSSGSSSGSSGGGGGGLAGKIAKFVLPPPPPRPRLPSLPDTAQIEALLGPPPPAPTLESARALLDPFASGIFGTPFALYGLFGLGVGSLTQFRLDEETQRAARQLASAPPSIFRGERDAIREELGGRTPDEALQALRQDDLRYRDLLYAVVGNVAPPQIRAYVPELLETFNTIDRFLYGQRAPEGTPEFPVRDLPDNGQLKPVVKKLTVRAPSGEEFSIRGFAHDLSELLRAQSYPVPAG